jgi:tryptophan-rich sensory protein
MRLNYFLIPLITIFVAWLGGRFTMTAVHTWYRDIRKPSWTPPGTVIGAVWTVLYILAAISAFLVWNVSSLSINGVPFIIVALFVLNATVNIFWSYTFFYRRRIGPAIWVCLFLDITIVALIQFITPVSHAAAWLLVPYAAWVTFAAYLNYRVWEMNKTFIKRS